MSISTELLARLRQVAKAATPGPWFRVEREGKHGDDVMASYSNHDWGHAPCRDIEAINDRLVISSWGYDADGVEMKDADCTFIATFNPFTVQELLNEIERLRGLLNEAAA